MEWKFLLKYIKVEIMGIYERIIYLVIGNALKSTSSMYSYLARISTYIGISANRLRLRI
jgi:hypothetical protein